MKAVLISIQPKWCELIASGKKTVEVRKTKPKIETPFKCYIYCTANKQGAKDLLEIHSKDGKIRKGNSKVIGEFVCDRIRCEKEVADGLVDIVLESTSCVSAKELVEYANGNVLYSWHISDLVIYDKPKELREFRSYNVSTYIDEELGLPMPTHEIKRPPQSYMYVEELRCMAAKESICRNCFHSYVCEQFNEDKDDNNEKCHFSNDHYIPRADVVPKTDLDLLKSTITHKEEEAYNKGYEDAKADILEKIQAEVERAETLAKYGDDFYEGKAEGVNAAMNCILSEGEE